MKRLNQITEEIESMPRTWEQDRKGLDAVAHLHYFKGGMDWYITERDISGRQYQAFGLVDFGVMDSPELGYISIVEIISLGAELDLHWTPKRLGEIPER